MLIESGHTDAPLTLHEPSPCFNPNTDNINYQEVTRDEQRRDERSLLFWQTVARQAKESGGVMVQVVDEALGLSAMQQAEERIAKLLELRCVRVPVVAELSVGTVVRLVPSLSPSASPCSQQPSCPAARSRARLWTWPCAWLWLWALSSFFFSPCASPASGVRHAW